jgi:hypothetical protein
MKEPIPIEEYYSLKETYSFLYELIDPQKTPRLPKEIRDKARKCIRNYPVERDLNLLYEGVGFWNPRKPY